MILDFVKKLFLSRNDKIIADYIKTVQTINSLEVEFEKYSTEELKNKTFIWKSELSKGSTLNSILPYAFAAVREMSKRTLNMRHYDVQLMGGMALNDGKIAEMKTGEGKTLVSTLAAYLNALSGKGVHIVTVNDYLAKRDYEWMSRIHNSLGLTVGLAEEDKNHGYACDITYVTNSELGFDYLRDNMRFDKKSMNLISRKFNYAIVDEIDSILIDEARTPLIISGPSHKSSDLYLKIDKIVQDFLPEHYEINDKHQSVLLTDAGNEMAEDKLIQFGLVPAGGSMYDSESYELINHIIQALKARHIMHKDVDYLIKDGEVVLVDEFTGRTMDGRRYSNGLHQAIEAKEKVRIQNENQTLASTTYQNLFRLYDKLSGMTGTAKTEAREFFDTYSLEVVSIPTHRTVIRKDHDDLVFRTEMEKFNHITKKVADIYKNGQPVLIGTTSIEKSEKLSSLFNQNKIKHNVLNAKYHAMEAQIIANAGRKYAVTIATNMAGRGTDILLGGSVDDKILASINGIDDHEEIKRITNQIHEEHNRERQEVVNLGGLFVMGSERHESRRIDNQLRGRSGRLGDPGESQFFLSLQDSLLRIFGGDKIGKTFERLGFKDDQPLNHPMLNKVILSSQKRLENFHYDIRKNLLKYDDIKNEQRNIVYGQRAHLIELNDFTDTIAEMAQSTVNKMIDRATEMNEIMDFEYIIQEMKECYGDDIAVKLNQDTHNIKTMSRMETLNSCTLLAVEHINSVFSQLSKDVALFLQKHIILASLDLAWKEHIHQIESIRETIHLRAYAQKDPLTEYKIEAFSLFDTMHDKFHYYAAQQMSHLDPERHKNLTIEDYQSVGISGREVLNPNEERGDA